MYTILVVDDEKDIVSALEIYLKAEGYRVLSACNGKEALAAAAREDVHLILMDIMMPVMDGLSAMAQLRQTSNVPVILLTAKGEDTDKVLGLNVGADDYITKPFNPVELLARVRALARRPAPVAVSGRPCCGDLTLDMGTLVLTGDKEQCTLSKKEAELLAALMENAGQTLSRSFLFGRVWGPGADVEEASLDSYVHFIRRRLRAVSSRVTVDTVRGVGYRLLDGGTGA